MSAGPGPCRPSKLRGDVDAQHLPACAVSPFDPTHIEQPESRHSKPESLNIATSPSASARRLMLRNPGKMTAGTLARRPFRTLTALTVMREYEHEPMNTKSITISVIGVSGTSAM
ncbi:MAG: hypothetical protein AABZ67_17395 [Pseudomonadota bacterium]